MRCGRIQNRLISVRFSFARRMQSTELQFYIERVGFFFFYFFLWCGQNAFTNLFTTKASTPLFTRCQFEVKMCGRPNDRRYHLGLDRALINSQSECSGTSTHTNTHAQFRIRFLVSGEQAFARQMQSGVESVVCNKYRCSVPFGAVAGQFSNVSLHDVRVLFFLLSFVLHKQVQTIHTIIHCLTEREPHRRKTM